MTRGQVIHEAADLHVFDADGPIPPVECVESRRSPGHIRLQNNVRRKNENVYKGSWQKERKKKETL